MSGLILAQRLILSVGKLDLPFGFGRNTIAGCWTVSPRAHRLEHMAIAGQTGTLQDERAVDTAVGTDDEAHFDPLALVRSSEKGSRCGQGLWRLNLLASRARSKVRHGNKLSGANHMPGNLGFALFERR